MAKHANQKTVTQKVVAAEIKKLVNSRKTAAAVLLNNKVLISKLDLDDELYIIIDTSKERRRRVFNKRTGKSHKGFTSSSSLDIFNNVIKVKRAQGILKTKTIKNGKK